MKWLMERWSETERPWEVVVMAVLGADAVGFVVWGR